ncbi:MAG TPA: prepilin-type N-terminal cleavage/methylation domain-containing protein [Dongiaceae bacterium]|nr:prepilin-type N-terminal cleavage/methylation domain-containing protein [Dongiaceae bacterium]
MSLTNIKLKGQNEGFTIVELLIVVVVIAILAAITIVSYNGITNRANQSAAKETASTVQKKAELFNSDTSNNRYPLTTAELSNSSSNSWYVPTTSFATSNGAVGATNGSKNVQLLICGTGSPANVSAITASTIVGARVAYWDFGATNGTPSLQYMDDGTVSGTGIACFAPTS